MDAREKQIEILKWIKKKCNEYHLCGFLSGCSMLGAGVNHGYVENDNDIDIGFCRSDYEKVLSILEEESVAFVKLINWEHDSKFGFFYSKLVWADEDEYAYVDILPYEKMCSNRITTFLMDARLKLYGGIRRIRNGYSYRGIKKVALRVLAFFCRKDDEQLVVTIKRLLASYNRKGNTNYLICFAGGHGIKDYIQPIFQRTQFEDIDVWIPQDWKQYARRIYGRKYWEYRKQ